MLNVSRPFTYIIISRRIHRYVADILRQHKHLLHCWNIHSQKGLHLKEFDPSGSKFFSSKSSPTLSGEVKLSGQSSSDVPANAQHRNDVAATS